MTVSQRYLNLLLVVGMLALFALSIGYARHAIMVSEANDRKAITTSNRASCAIWSTLDDAYRSTPPTTPTGRSLAEAIHSYRVALGC